MKLIFTLPLAFAQLDFTDNGTEAGIISVMKKRLPLPVFQKLAIHGCWCSRMDSDSFALGGITALDALDDICKNWFKQRNCMRLEGGRCNRRDTSYARSGNGSCEDAVNIYNINSFCAQDTCSVDEFYAERIANALNDMVDFQPLPGSLEKCPKDAPSDSEKICYGQLPNYQVADKESVEQNCQINKGCFIDAVDDRIMEHRALNVGDDLGGVPNAYDFCRYQCLKQGYQYFGLQWGKECWCSNNSNQFSKHGQVNDEECAQGCVDQDDWTHCGAGNRMNVFEIQQTLGEACLNQQDEVEEEYLGCWKDGGSRVFPFRAPNFNGVPDAQEYCREECDAAGYDHYGLQYSQECFCGFETYDKYGQLDESNCNKICNDQRGDAICGGTWAMSVYKFK